jgi:hypothetical protein
MWSTLKSWNFKIGLRRQYARLDDAMSLCSTLEKIIVHRIAEPIRDMLDHVVDRPFAREVEFNHFSPPLT